MLKKDCYVHLELIDGYEAVAVLVEVAEVSFDAPGAREGRDRQQREGERESSSPHCFGYLYQMLSISGK